MGSVSRNFRLWPYYSPDEIAAATAVLQSGKVNYWTGQEGREFEKEFAAYAQTRYAIAVSNGTTALELALRSLGLGPGDEVIVPARTFVASATSVMNCGARPVFADIDRNSQLITERTIREVLSPYTRGIVVVHLAGWPCEMDDIMKLATEHGLLVVEDCAQAHGARYRGRPVGSFGHAAAFSFCQDKIISTGGEGGMVLTNDYDVWKKAWSYKDHGKSYNAVYNQKHAPGFRWVHHSIGTNWRMTEIQAAIGRAQLKKLPFWFKRRNRNAAILKNHLQHLPALRVPDPPHYLNHAYYKFDVFVRAERLKPAWTRDRIMAEIVARDVPCTAGICPEIYLEKAFQRIHLQPATRLPIARELGQTGLTLLVHPTMGDRDMAIIGKTLVDVMHEATAVMPSWQPVKQNHVGYRDLERKTRTFRG